MLPLNLTAVYPIPRDLNWLALPFALSILATLAISAGLFLLRRRWPGLLAAWLCYLVVLAPNSGIIRISDQIAADRYSYMSMLGLVMLAAAGFCWLWHMSSRWRPGAIGIIAIGLGALLGLTALTRNQCRTWLNSETLWAHALTHGANSSAVAHNNLGNVLYSQGKHEAAEAHYTEALRLNPDHADAHNNLGTSSLRQGKYEEAAAHFAEALRLNPGYADAHNNLGHVLYAQGKYDEAEAHFTEARAAQSRRRRCPQHPGEGPLPPREVRGRRRLITLRPYGSIPASSTHTSTLASSTPNGGSTRPRRLISLTSSGSNPANVRRTPQPGQRRLPPGELRGRKGSLRGGHTARSRLGGSVQRQRDHHGCLSRNEVS